MSSRVPKHKKKAAGGGSGSGSGSGVQSPAAAAASLSQAQAQAQAAAAKAQAHTHHQKKHEKEEEKKEEEEKDGTPTQPTAVAAPSSPIDSAQLQLPAIDQVAMLEGVMKATSRDQMVQPIVQHAMFVAHQQQQQQQQSVSSAADVSGAQSPPTESDKQIRQLRTSIMQLQSSHMSVEKPLSAPDATIFGAFSPLLSLLGLAAGEFRLASWDPPAVEGRVLLVPPKQDGTVMPRGEEMKLAQLFGASSLLCVASNVIYRQLEKLHSLPATEFAHFMSEKTVKESDARWWSDESFGFQRLAGALPNQIQKVTSSDFLRRHFTDPSDATALPHLESLRAGGQLFMLDHRDLCTLPIGDRGMFVPATITLLQYTRGQADPLMPVAIAIQGPPKQRANTECQLRANAAERFTADFRAYPPPRHTECEDTHWRWKLAKAAAQCSEWNEHEIVAHLACTHLFEEALLVPLMQAVEQDPSGAGRQHPVYALLRPHLNKTLPLNRGAREKLLPGIIGVVAGSTVDGSTLLIERAWAEARTPGGWKRYFLEENIAARGTGTGDIDDADYPYQQDARALNGAIREFVESSLEGLGSVNSDSLLCRWSELILDSQDPDVRDAMEGLPFPDFRSSATHADLADLVTMLIFNSTVQHSAVNYPQGYWMAFTPNCPGSLNTASFICPPSQFAQLTKKEYFNALPTRGLANLGYLVAFLLSQPVGRAADGNSWNELVRSLTSSLVGWLASVVPLEKDETQDFTLLQYAQGENSVGTKAELKDSQAAQRLQARLGEVDQAINQRNRGVESTRQYHFLSPGGHTLANGIII